MGSLALTLFSCAILIFQVSCSKDAIAQVAEYILPAASSTNLGGVMIGDGLQVTSAGKLSVVTNDSTNISQKNIILLEDQLDGFIICNYDGSGKKKIPITLPAGRQLNGTNAKLSPDGTKLFFDVYESSTGTSFIYSASIDGSNITPVISSDTRPYKILGAY